MESVVFTAGQPWGEGKFYKFNQIVALFKLFSMAVMRGMEWFVR
jgi:hypothetical protein